MTELDDMLRHERRKGQCWPLCAAQSVKSVGFECSAPRLSPAYLTLWSHPSARELP